jgi:hypothetical protein
LTCPHRVLVAPGQRVRCGETVLVELLERPLVAVPVAPGAPAAPAAAGGLR